MRISRACFTKLVFNKVPVVTKGKPWTGYVARGRSRSEKYGMIGHIARTIKKYPEAVVLTQVGSFFEIYFEQAIEWGPRLGLRVARKGQYNPMNGETWISMAGFPVYQLEKYLKVLVQDLGKTVVLLEQNPNSMTSSGTELEKRPVSQIFTPGTLISESLVNAHRANYLLTINMTQFHVSEIVKAKKGNKNLRLEPDSAVSLAWTDVSDGSLFYQETTIANLLDDLLRINPVEIVIDHDLNKSIIKCPELFTSLELERFRITSTSFPVTGEQGLLKSHRGLFLASEAALKHTFDSLGARTQTAVAALVEYASTNLPGSMIKFELPELYNRDSVVVIDRHAIAGLEIFESSARAGSVRGSLFNVLSETVTPGGARLLGRWLMSPLRDIGRINSRLDKIELFLRRRSLRQDLEERLRDLPDGKRNLQKLAMRKINPMDLVIYAKTVECMSKILECVKASQEKGLNEWVDAMEVCIQESKAVACEINAALDASVLMGSSNESGGEGDDDAEATDVGIIKEGRQGTLYRPIIEPGYSAKIQKIRQREKQFHATAAAILERAKKQSIKPSAVKLRWSPQYSFHILYQNPMPENIDPAMILRQTKNTMVVLDPELTAAGRAHASYYSAIEEAESEVLETLRESALNTVREMRRALEVADEIDVTQSLSKLAITMKLVRPVITESRELAIQAGRHLVVERSLLHQGQPFVANDCNLTEHEPICMITGPNMGGKSTYIRQNAVICLLAHIGSFVPAESATIGVLDRLMCRIGSGDDLFRGRSTFMMEMLESAYILRNATDQTLAILDEVGRGTSRDDGIAIAYAAVKHMVQQNRCRALFATHYGQELNAVLQEEPDILAKVRSLKSQVALESSDLKFVHKLVEGVSTSSHGILIAKLAGFPPIALDEANKLHVPEFQAVRPIPPAKQSR